MCCSCVSLVWLFCLVSGSCVVLVVGCCIMFVVCWLACAVWCVRCVACCVLFVGCCVLVCVFVCVKRFVVLWRYSVCVRVLFIFCWGVGLTCEL